MITQSSSVQAWVRRLAAVLVLVAFMPMATGCFGQFRLTKKVYSFNQRVDPDKWIQWFAFVVLSPFYGFSAGADAVVFNSIEFWTGENPIQAKAGSTRVVRSENGDVATLTRLESGAVSMELRRADGTVQSYTLTKGPGYVSALDAQGNLLARVADVNGLPTVIEGSLAH